MIFNEFSIFSSANDADHVERASSCVGHHHKRDVDGDQQLPTADSAPDHQQPFVPAVVDDELGPKPGAELPKQLAARFRFNQDGEPAIAANRAHKPVPDGCLREEQQSTRFGIETAPPNGYGADKQLNLDKNFSRALLMPLFDIFNDNWGVDASDV